LLFYSDLIEVPARASSNEDNFEYNIETAAPNKKTIAYLTSHAFLNSGDLSMIV